MVNDWILLQLADSAFPSGGFAHSAGLEAAVQLGEVTAPHLEPFIARSLWQAGSLVLPVATAAHTDPAALPQIDRVCDAMTPSAVANAASRAQGQSFLRACVAAFEAAAEPVAEIARRERLPCHLAPIFGTLLRSLGSSREQMQRLMLFLVHRGLVSAAVRLALVGPLQGQAIQARAALVSENVLNACQDITLEEAAQVDPILELLQGHQDRLYSRLFRS